MYMTKRLHTLLLAALLAALPMGTALAQKVDPKGYYTDKEGYEQESDNIADGEAPLDVIFRANPTDMDGFTPSYEWHFRRTATATGGDARELFVRYEEDTQYTFTESGSYDVVLKTRLEQDGQELDSVVVKVTIAESRLEFPNAFSPNGDGTNDVYGAKGVCDPNNAAHWKSIVSFHAIVVNRWGQKLYEWYDPAGSWDGTFHGHPVKDGVYFLQCIAKGADGKDYHIRKDINLLRGYTEGRNNSGTTE